MSNTYTYKGKKFTVGEEVRIFTGSLYIPTVEDYRGVIVSFPGNDRAIVSTPDEGDLRMHLQRLHKMEEGELHGVIQPDK